ncbi:MAG: hypothetical protein WA030_02390 [Candidatus Microsaccharimonas sp.]
MTTERPSSDEQNYEVNRHMHFSEAEFRDHFMELLLNREQNLQEIAKMLITARYRLLECRQGTALHRSRSNTLRYVYVAYKGDADIDKERLDELAAIEDMDPLHAPDPIDEAFTDIVLHFHTTEQQ